MSGIVGCGKTTLIQKLIGTFQFQVFSFTGDDVIFRESIRKDSKYLFDVVRSKTSKKSILFIDEVQKCEEIFDALKYSFDHGEIHFIVSGSNPEFLSTEARKRLQRRATFIRLQPFSMPEILGSISEFEMRHALGFFEFIWRGETLKDLDVPQLAMTTSVEDHSTRYLKLGGIPLSFLADDELQSLSEIQKIVERGFLPVFTDNHNLFDLVLTDLAKQHSKEFSYQGLFQRTGLKRREPINTIVAQLKGHGYLYEKRPFFDESDQKRSYLISYSYCDPGIVSYLSGNMDERNLGFRIEGMIHSRLAYLSQFVPLKSHINYFKPYTVDVNNKVKFKPGEIDFIFTIGRRIIPIEVKSNNESGSIDTRMISDFVRSNKCPFGIIFYGGVPRVDTKNKLVYWPYWLF